jgi:hypothetical protein
MNSLRLSWTVVVAALMLLAVLEGARAQDLQTQPPRIAIPLAHALDIQSGYVH